MTVPAWAILAFYAAIFLLAGAITLVVIVVRYCRRSRGRRFDREIAALISDFTEEEVRDLWQR